MPSLNDYEQDDNDERCCDNAHRYDGYTGDDRASLRCRGRDP